MTSRVTWASWGALLLGLASACGCQGEETRYPPPQPFPGMTSGDQGGSGGGTGTGTGASGGSGGSATTTGTIAEANLCECAFGMVDSSACGACVNDFSAPMKACEDVNAECNADPACKALLECRLQCVGLSDAEKITCIQGCYAALDLSAPENHAFVNAMDCFCGQCSVKCAPSMAIACP